MTDGLKDVKTRFDTIWKANEPVAQGYFWVAAESALVVPFDDPARRLDLEADVRQVGRKLLIGSDGGGGARQGVSPEKARDTARSRARLQARMALAILGNRLFEEMPPADGREGLAQVRDHLRDVRSGDDWSKPIDLIGRQIGMRWRAIPALINQRDASASKPGTASARTDLRAADRLSRQIDGALAGAVGDDPSHSYRGLVLRDLLLNQAARTLSDHWFSEDEAADPPYYVVEGRAYLDEASKLDPRTSPTPDLSATLDLRLRADGKVRVTGPKRLVLTTERALGLAYRLDVPEDGDIPAGFPVVWLEPGRDLSAEGPSSALRAAVPFGADGSPPIRGTVASESIRRAEEHPPEAPRVEGSAIGLRGLYRGQVIKLDTAVSVHPLAENILVQVPPPTRANVTVRADRDVLSRYGSSGGSLAIVLDCSGSMGAKQGPPAKFQEATKALRGLLTKVSRGTKVSVWIFGEAVGTALKAEAEQTIRQMLPPTDWDPDDSTAIDALMTRLEYPAIYPFNESPILRTMILAREDLRNAPGFKSMIVITDGMDNRFQDDPDYNRQKKDVRTALRDAFSASGIEVNVVGYKVVGPEEEAAKKQFSVVEDLPVPGRYYDVTDARKLAVTLERALRRRLKYLVEEPNNTIVEGFPEGGLDVSDLGGGDRWFAPAFDPGGFKLVVSADRTREKRIILRRGDLLLVDLLDDPKGVEIRRGLFTQDDELYRLKPSRENARKEWRLSALQNRSVEGKGLQMIAALERRVEPGETALEVIRPRMAWLEAKPSEDDGSGYSSRWGVTYDQPAPTWGLNVPKWPKSAGASSPARPVLTAWWNPDRETAPAGIVDRLADYRSLRDLTDRKVPLKTGGEVIVESVAIETHRVEVAPGVLDDRSCLVVRLACPEGKPFWSRPMGLDAAGSEHRFFTRANKSTSLFWPVEPDQALAGLALYSVAEFKAEAERRKFVVELPLSRRPTRPIAGRCRSGWVSSPGVDRCPQGIGECRPWTSRRRPRLPRPADGEANPRRLGSRPSGRDGGGCSPWR